MIWEKIRGAEEPMSRFRRSVERGRLSHAYLFVGPEGVGKKLFARTLAQCLLCDQFADTELAACGKCSGCRQMLAGTHPDFFLVGCPEGKRELPIDVFLGPRERRGQEGLCYDLSLKPMAGDRKVAVIDDAERMNVESSNALLKTLEEPPPQSLLILIASNSDAILPTIRSRCQQVRFAGLSEQDVAELLLEQDLAANTDEAQSMAALSEGSLAIASQLADPALRQLRDSLYDSLAARSFDSLATTDRMLEGIEAMGGEPAVQRQYALWLIRFAIEFYRRAALELAGDSHLSPVAQIQEFTERLRPSPVEGLEIVAELFDRTTVAASHLEQHMPVPLCLDGLFDSLGQIGRSMTVR